VISIAGSYSAGRAGNMGYFFRRSAKFRPFRLNFSKSGIGASIGVKGARLTMTPRGTSYITVGSHGFYYRETLSNRGRTPAGHGPAVLPVAGQGCRLSKASLAAALRAA